MGLFWFSFTVNEREFSPALQCIWLCCSQLFFFKIKDVFFFGVMGPSERSGGGVKYCQTYLSLNGGQCLVKCCGVFFSVLLGAVWPLIVLKELDGMWIHIRVESGMTTGNLSFVCIVTVLFKHKRLRLQSWFCLELNFGLLLPCR